MNWLNVMIKLFYECNRSAIYLKVKESLDPILETVKPGYISKIVLTLVGSTVGIKARAKQQIIRIN